MASHSHNNPCSPLSLKVLLNRKILKQSVLVSYWSITITIGVTFPYTFSLSLVDYDTYFVSSSSDNLEPLKGKGPQDRQTLCQLLRVEGRKSRNPFKSNVSSDQDRSKELFFLLSVSDPYHPHPLNVTRVGEHSRKIK